MNYRSTKKGFKTQRFKRSARKFYKKGGAIRSPSRIHDVARPSQETRIDPVTGEQYTFQEFLDVYGGDEEWHLVGEVMRSKQEHSAAAAARAVRVGRAPSLEPERAAAARRGWRPAVSAGLGLVDRDPSSGHPRRAASGSNPHETPRANPQRAAEGPSANRSVNLFFFDLDDTLIHSDVHPYSEMTENFAEISGDGSHIYTTNEVLNVLRNIHHKDNAQWFVISKGGNKHKLRMLENKLGFSPVDGRFDLGEEIPKSDAIISIIKGLVGSGIVLNTITFIDDDDDNIKDFIKAKAMVKTAARIPQDRIFHIPVESHVGEMPDWMVGMSEQQRKQIWPKIIQGNEERQILSILELYR